MSKKQKNVLGGDLELCSSNPLTGWYRDGCCNTDDNDNGLHTVCAKVNSDFLEWCKSAGNDLVTPHPEFGFPGLKDGDNSVSYTHLRANETKANLLFRIML